MSVEQSAVQRSPLAELERFLVVASFALYVGVVALQIADHVYVQPRVAAINHLWSR